MFEFPLWLKIIVILMIPGYLYMWYLAFKQIKNTIRLWLRSKES